MIPHLPIKSIEPLYDSSYRVRSLRWKKITFTCGCHCTWDEGLPSSHPDHLFDYGHGGRVCDVHFCPSCIEASPLVKVVHISQHSGEELATHLSELKGNGRNREFFRHSLDLTAPWGSCIKRVEDDGTLTPIASSWDSSG